MQSTERHRSAEHPPRVQQIKQHGTSGTSADRFMSVKATARALGVSRPTVYRAYHAGVFPGRKFGRSYGILRSFVEGVVAVIESGQPVDVMEYAALCAVKGSESAA